MRIDEPHPRAPLQLEMARCQHCTVNTPNLQQVGELLTGNSYGLQRRVWGVYDCARCGGIVCAAWPGSNTHPNARMGTYPGDAYLDETIDPVAREYLRQCKESLHAPAGAIMLAASAVDAMLKSKGYKDGNLSGRIRQAASEHLITQDMARWAHQVRLDANDQRHADDGASLPEEEDARRSLDFALALAEIIFVLPARVTRGLNESGNDPAAT